MAKIIRPFSETVNDTYTEGPFVLANPLGNGFAIKVEQRGCMEPSVPDVSIHKFKEKVFRDWCGLRTNDKSLAVRCVDWLNDQYRAGKIVLHGNKYIAIGYGDSY